MDNNSYDYVSHPHTTNVGEEVAIKHSCGGDVELVERYEGPYEIWHELRCKKCGWVKELYGIDG